MEVKRTIKTDVESFEVGDIIKFKLTDGEKVKAMAVRQEANGMLFVFVDCLKDEYPMFKDPDAMGSMDINYFNSDLRHALTGEILDRFPDEIRSRMVGMRIDNESNMFFDLIRVPTEREIFGENHYGTEECSEIKRFKGMKKRRNRMAFQTVDGEEPFGWYWLQNRVEATIFNFAHVDHDGNANYNGASHFLSVRLVFLLS